MKKKALILGVEGFLGKAMWKHLQRSKTRWEVFGLDHAVSRTSKNIFACDIQQQRKLLDVLGSIKPEIVFHFAGGRFVEKKQLMEANISTTRCLFEVIAKIRKYRPRVIIPGTAAEYGKMPPRRRKMNESDTPRPLTNYGEAKYKQTCLALDYARDGHDVVVARIFNISGEETPSGLAIGRFAEQIVQIESGRSCAVIHSKNLDGRRDFLDIEDVCRALLSLARHGMAGQVYNVCSGRAYRIRELLHGLLALSKIKGVRIEEDEGDFSMSCDVIGSNVKIKFLCDWRPKVSMRKSLRNTMNSYRSLIRENG
ncbi:MAG: NAD-dependent epimerase/dehydratase family protein [Candidatus Omnitrophica bacterium]|nr:NAD-dependent epimerase/dehydratase family protein [Candidatus Omnitrophota bacterium]